jgi:hypothetical protein
MIHASPENGRIGQIDLKRCIFNPMIKYGEIQRILARSLGERAGQL